VVIQGPILNYITRGGQDILFPLTRFNAELSLGGAHTIALLYQPLEVNTTVLFQEDVLIDSKTFDTGEVVDIRYSFPFWRLTYLYDFAQEENLQLEAGLALQLRIWPSALKRSAAAGLTTPTAKT
jgi:hypothetical protein